LNHPVKGENEAAVKRRRAYVGTSSSVRPAVLGGLEKKSIRAGDRGGRRGTAATAQEVNQGGEGGKKASIRSLYTCSFFYFKQRSLSSMKKNTLQGREGGKGRGGGHGSGEGSSGQTQKVQSLAK